MTDSSPSELLYNLIYVLNLQKVKVSEIIERVSEIAREITLIHDRTISKSINCEDSDVMIDIQLFERVIQNIFSNAIQYSPDKSNIELLIMTTDKILSISVIDEGPGFSNEDLKRGTEQFYRGDKSRHSATNYGLGLYNSWKIMLLHNGRIILENNSCSIIVMVILTLHLHHVYPSCFLI